MIKDLINKTAYGIYSAGWSLVIPFMKRNSRLSEGFGQRLLLENTCSGADIWIQAASGGEAYLAITLLKTLQPGRQITVLVTSNTSQGISILEKGAGEIHPAIDLKIAFSPFDKPGIIKKAVRQIDPSVMVLLELEMWPGLMKALKSHRCRTIVVNGRLTDKSLRGYLTWPSLWRDVSPDSILAISGEDAERFRTLFPETDVRQMSNIKFDRIDSTETSGGSVEPSVSVLKRSGKKVVLFASVRREEEGDVGQMITALLSSSPDIDIWLFPRHLERIGYWKTFLTEKKIAWSLRTETAKRTGNLILWDRFGELSGAVTLADAAFVGGSLAPLGGQNFLEVLATGLVPVIGPYRDNFLWTSESLIEEELLLVAPDRDQAVASILKQLDTPSDRDLVRKQFFEYLKARTGGTRLACKIIEAILNEGD